MKDFIKTLLRSHTSVLFIALSYVILLNTVTGATSPQNVTISKNAGLVTINWDEVKGAEKYYIYKGYLPYSEMVKIDSTNSLFYQDNEISDKCFYKISAEDRFTVNMVYVEGGTFFMGDHYSEGYYDEQPVHEVTVNEYFIQDTEVTQKDWVEIMGYNPCSSTWGLGDNYPVYGVNWYDILVYCNKRSMRDGLEPCYEIKGATDPFDWGEVPIVIDSNWDAVKCNWSANGYRLLTEAEWEYAGRGGKNWADNFRYSGCQNESDLGNYAVFSSSIFLQTKSKLPNQLGLYDMTGNVCEYCWNVYSPYYDLKSTNPVGNPGSRRTRRGGARYSLAKGQRISNRAEYNPSYRYPGGEIGFRIGSTDTSQEFYNITVVDPDSTTLFTKGRNVLLVWTDNLSGNVSIELYQDGVYYTTIAASTTSSGYYNWYVPNDLDTEKDYKIKISSIDNIEVYDLSDESFNVCEEFQYELKILSPSKEAIWMKNRIQTIIFPDNFADDVKIDLYKSGSFHSSVNANAISNGKYAWLIPGYLENANDYSIKITNVMADSVYSFSDQFEIADYIEPCMVFVEGGIYNMGDVLGIGQREELPVHQVTLSSFYIGRYEITQNEWLQIMDSNPSTAAIGIGDNYPVHNVTWYNVLVYCNKRSISEGLTPCYTISGSTDPANWGAVPTAVNSTWNAVICNWNADGYRLPTEAEWEYAARGGNNYTDNYKYSGCDIEIDLHDFAWYENNNNCSSSYEVGTLLPNQLGLYDMNGNVYEWCWDWYLYYSSSSVINPTGPASGSYRVQRGGSFYNSSDVCRVSNRDYLSPPYYMNLTGLRIVRSN
jgi:formylglycine-generating enzyme required for sulfatase activity